MTDDERDSTSETLFWRAQPGIADDIAEGRQALAAGETWSEQQVRARYGVALRPNR